MEIGGGADKACSEDKNAAGRSGTAVGAGGCGKRVGEQVNRGRVHRWWSGSVRGLWNLGWWNPKGRIDCWSLPRANSSAMLVVMLPASWLTVPSIAAMRAWSSEVDDVSETRGRGAPEDVGGGRCIEGAPEYAGGTPAGVGGGGACVGGG
ncbi:hypothetical protein CRG98_009125 [Punica granatum]|uniref:Uncharacterized protein n=1 Tax=Punica granatum TaxID=22663 RepID=A0A2I0KPT0_PUNGR|nr:hypothetical protein CRG98_009125 [Punica granatum]